MQTASNNKTDILDILSQRFNANMSRHSGISWSDVLNRLKDNPSKITVLENMEHTGGEPDVVGTDENTGEFIFFDCSAESPKGRRSLCYDRAAWESRKEHKPVGTALDMAGEIGIEILTEEQYRRLQTLGVFDAKTSSWIKTPESIRKQGGAVFCDYRFGQVFMYHNGAESYYAARGFRGSLKV